MDNAHHGIHLSLDLRDPQPQQRVAMRIVVLGDFSAGTGAGHRALPVYVNQDNLNETLNGYGATLFLEVENFLQSVRAPLHVAIRITDLSDLSPAGVVAHMPDLTTIFLFKESVQMLLRREISAAEFTTGLSAYENCAALMPALQRCRTALAPQRNMTPPPVIKGRGSDEVERIFDLVATPGQPAAPTTQGIEAVLNSIGKERLTTSAPPELTQVLNELTALLDRQITAILHHPLFQRMEATWRSVKLLLDHAGRQDVKIELIDTPRDQLVETFHARVFEAENSGLNATPLGLALIDFEFDSASSDITMLHAIAQDAQALQTPVVFSVRTNFFGTAPDEHHPLPFLGTLLDQPRYNAWNALRAKECSRWLCGAYNPLLLRARYTCENTQGLNYTETIADHKNYVWGYPGWAVALLAARSMTNAHWPTQITGMQHGQITGLDVLMYRDHSGNEVAIPLCTLLSAENTDDLAQFGFASLTCQPNRDAVYLLRAPTLRAAEKHPGRATHTAQELTSLPYQLLASRVTALLGAHRDLLLEGGNAQHIAANTQKIIDSLLADTGPGASTQIDVQPDPDRPGHHLLDLKLHTGRDILNGATLHLTVPV